MNYDYYETWYAASKTIKKKKSHISGPPYYTRHPLPKIHYGLFTMVLVVFFLLFLNYSTDGVGA